MTSMDMTSAGVVPERYWATAPAEQLPDEMMRVIRDYYQSCEEKGRFALWARANELYYGRDAEGGWANSAAVTFGGTQGEQVMLRVNHFRSLLDHMLALVTATRPTLIARAVNADADSQTQAKLADGLLDFYLSEKHLEEKMVDVVRHVLKAGEGWLYVSWDPDDGEAVGQQQSMDGAVRTLYEGDIHAEALHPRDVIRDPAHHDVRSHKWLIVHRRMSRWDLVALYGDGEETAEAIRSAPSVPDLSLGSPFTDDERETPDEVSVFELYHERCPAVPDGRYAMMLGDLLLLDGPLPYASIPVIPAVPDREENTAHGYTTTWDLMSLQAAIDSIYSTALSNHDAFGLQNLWVPKGSGWDVSNVEGLRVWQSNAKPEPIKLLEDQGNSIELAKLFQDGMGQMTGINSVARGNPDPNIKSGAMAALVHSMASQYNNGLQRAYGRLMENAGTHLIQVLQRYASTPRLADISGQRNKPLLREFVGEDIARVRRVTVDLGNAIMRTAQSRHGVAQELLAAGAIQTPQEFLEIIATGRLDPLLDRHETRRRGIDSENERLINGEGARVLWTDDHQYHIDKHLTLLDEPTIRDNDEVTAVIVDHIQLHLEIWARTAPESLAAIGLPPYPLAAPPPAGPGAQSAPNGPDLSQMAPQAQPQGMPEPNLPPAPGVAQEAGVGQPNMPSMPSDPRTGEPYNPGAM